MKTAHRTQFSVQVITRYAGIFILKDVFEPEHARHGLSRLGEKLLTELVAPRREADSLDAQVERQGCFGGRPVVRTLNPRPSGGGIRLAFLHGPGSPGECARCDHGVATTGEESGGWSCHGSVFS